ncbi:hypothetical protein [Alicyclobacillus kakegawensis]|uniref:hypothetical protein n=1 Tax=Alicyclobacillus kakegawensis TaxID=392012 RepID=UPI0008336794|nr:hypothetical protein [Alicyclobacillus kakegawensis]
MDAKLNACRRQIEQWLEDYGESVFTLCTEQCEDAAAARDCFVHVFLAAFRALYHQRDRKLQDAPQAWLLSEVSSWTPGARRLASVPAYWEAHSSYEHLRCQTQKLLKAQTVAEWARQRQQGPRWTRYALALTGVFGVLAVAAAEFGNAWMHPAHAALDHNSKSPALPPVLSNLPTATRAQFALGNTSVSLDHSASNDHALFLPRLQTTDTKGTREIDVYGYRYRDSGRALDSAQNMFGRIRLHSPGAKSFTESAWLVASWSFQPADERWAIATVEWQPRDAKTTDRGVLQVYALNLSTGQSALVKTLALGGNGADSYTVAAGHGRVVMEGEVGSAGSTSGAGAPVALPIQVYNLEGTYPQHALVLWKELRAPGMPLAHPVVTQTGIISEAADATSSGNSAWYFLNWNGQVSDLLGPPSDGQPHWALQGEDGRMWWVETTPDARQGHARQQVLMGSMNQKSSVDQSPALTLDGSVSGLAVSNGNLIWLQDVGNVRQLVVAEVK